MPAWMHERADHIQAKNPDMPKSEAFAIATQQMHALGKGPKGYGTAEGRATAKKKFDTPKDDVQTANPGKLKKAERDIVYEAFIDELANIKAAGLLGDIGAGFKRVLTTPIPGTPAVGDIVPGIASAAEKLKGLTGAGGKTPSGSFKAFQAARTAAGH
jgi:hypothetical protein